jgi:predicted short-subunit dehydrogenase-like oxidoreductase (DUF2520 family)
VYRPAPGTGEDSPSLGVHFSEPGIRTAELELIVIDTVTVIGRGRVGAAVAARFAERGIDVRDDDGDADVVLLCVPDSAISEAARGLPPGHAWIGHVSGATPLSALAPHIRRFSLHPLQTFTRSRGPEQLDGAFAAVTGETPEAVEVARELAQVLGLEAFELADDRRALYHAGAAVASNYLVTLYRIASVLFEDAGAPPEALVPLMQRTIENGFELTGPIARGDWATVEAHLDAIRTVQPDVEPVYRVLAEATRP